MIFLYYILFNDIQAFYQSYYNHPIIQVSSEDIQNRIILY